MFHIEVGPTYEDARRAYAGSIDSWDEQLERVADLMLRTDMDTSQAELVASILFVAERHELRHGEAPTEAKVRDEVLDWKANREPPLDPDKVAYYIRFLSSIGWLDGT